MMFGRPALPPPAPPTTEEAAELNAGLKALLANADPKLKAILEKYPSFDLVANPRPAPVYTPGAPLVDPPATNQLIADGWGYVTISPSSIQADNGAGLTRGIIGLTNQGQPRKPDDWAHCEHGRGALPARSTTSRQMRRLTQSTSASRVFRDTERLHSSPWPSSLASRWS